MIRVLPDKCMWACGRTTGAGHSRTPTCTSGGQVSRSRTSIQPITSVVSCWKGKGCNFQVLTCSRPITKQCFQRFGVGVNGMELSFGLLLLLFHVGGHSNTYFLTACPVRVSCQGLKLACYNNTSTGREEI